MKYRGLFVTFACVCAWAQVPAAEQAYVIDKLLVGVHEKQDLNSAIIKVLPTGTLLEVVKRDGELALVKDKDGDSGWVDVAYLMNEPPAQQEVERLAKENTELAARLKKLAEAPSPPPPDPKNAADGSKIGIDALTRENTDLKGKLSSELVKVSELQAQLAELQAAHANAPPGDLRVADLENTNRDLNHDLEAARQEIKSLTTALTNIGGIANLEMLARSVPKYVYVVSALLIIMAFGGGIYLMDYLNRRRHGGFRV